MKIQSIALTLMVMSLPVLAQQTVRYTHPRLNFCFDAPEGWIRQPRSEDKNIYEVADPDGDVHVMLWVTSTEMGGARYLKKMGGMKGLVFEGEPDTLTLGGDPSWIYRGPSVIGGRPSWSSLAVIHHGMSRKRPKENILYVVQMWCPKEKRAEYADRMERILQSVRVEELIFLPQTYRTRPDFSSPLVEEGEEVILARMKGGKWALIPVTVENGDPLIYSTRAGTRFGKDQQFQVDRGDFPTLAATGLHSDEGLKNKTRITGFPVEVITYIGRPGRFSGQGFMAEDEDIVSVLRGDNRLVTRLNLTHPQLARPLFHVWNLLLRELELNRNRRFFDVESFLYNGHRIEIEAEGSKGWQLSIFQDEIRGRFNIRIARDFTEEESDYLKNRYSEEAIRTIRSKLTVIGFSEMAPYYIMRYGFYEGHTGCRTDPLAVAFVFGLKSLRELDNAFVKKLDHVLTAHFTSESIL